MIVEVEENDYGIVKRRNFLRALVTISTIVKDMIVVIEEAVLSNNVTLMERCVVDFILIEIKTKI